MKLKIDECLGPSAKALIEADGHDVMTVHEQGLTGAVDERIYEVCCAERRILVTLDHDFGQTLRFPPGPSAGLAVIECKGRLSPRMIARLVSDFLSLLRAEPIDGRLWIVEPGRVRIHDEPQMAP